MYGHVRIKIIRARKKGATKIPYSLGKSGNKASILLGLFILRMAACII